MSTTSKHRNHLVEESAQRGSRSALPGGISMVAYALILLYYATLLSRHDVSQLILLIGVTSLPVLMGVLSMELQQRRDSHLGTWLFVGSMLLVAPVTATAVVNLGVMLGIAGAISAAQIASRTLSSHQIPRAIGAGVVSSIATVLVDRFWPGQRLVFATAGFVVPAIAAGLILANGFIIAGRYREFSIRAKLITSTVVLTALSLAVLTAFVGHNARRILMADVRRDLDRLAESQAVAVSELLGRESARLELLGQSQALQSRLQLANAAYPGVAGRVREKIETSAASWAAA
ncbi:MAG TPA: hypothetical protein VLE70_20740, partial [Anaerolineae bacterium]|nr:hypothetical protein [Anaerolineae bacterium]